MDCLDIETLERLALHWAPERRSSTLRANGELRSVSEVVGRPAGHEQKVVEWRADLRAMNANPESGHEAKNVPEP